MRSIRPSAPRQDLHALMDGFLRLGAELGVAVAADRGRGRAGLLAEIASCRLHDEQLPQSPTADTTASQARSSRRSSGAAGALMFAFRRRTTSRTPCVARRIVST